MQAAWGGVDAGADGDHGPVGPVGGTGRGEAGQVGEAAVDLHHGTVGSPLLHPAPVMVGDVVATQGHRPLGVGVGNHRRRSHQLATLEAHPFAGNDGPHLDTCDDESTGGAGGIGQGDRDPAHPPLHVAPRPADALDRPHGVHGVHEGGARVTRPRVGADHALTVQGGASTTTERPAPAR